MSAPLVTGLSVLVVLQVTNILVSFKVIHQRHKSELFLWTVVLLSWQIVSLRINK